MVNFKEIDRNILDSFKNTDFYLFNQFFYFDNSNYACSLLRTTNNNIINITKVSLFNNFSKEEFTILRYQSDISSLNIDTDKPIVTSLQFISKNIDFFIEFLDHREEDTTLFLSFGKPTLKSFPFFHHKKVTKIFIPSDNYWRPLSCSSYNLSLFYPSPSFSYDLHDFQKKALKNDSITNDFIYKALKNKHPSWAKQLISATFNSMTGYQSPSELISAISSIILDNNIYLKTFKFNNNYRLESLFDSITLHTMNTKETIFIKKIIGKHYDKLINNESRKLLKELFNLTTLNNKSNINKIISSKIIKFKDADEFSSFLLSQINLLNNWNNEYILKNLAKLDISFTIQNNMILAEIDSYEQMSSIGSRSWCITTSNYLFNEYTSCSFQYVLFDLNRRSDDLFSFIAFTKKSGNITFAHLKDDSLCDKAYLHTILKNFKFSNGDIA